MALSYLQRPTAINGFYDLGSNIFVFINSEQQESTEVDVTTLSPTLKHDGIESYNGLASFGSLISLETGLQVLQTL